MSVMVKKVSSILVKKKITISVVESCTGGLLSSSLTSIPGSSKYFQLGLITYSNNSKIKLLKIPKRILIKYGAVSNEVCLLMARNLRKKYNSNISISITGIAGPGGGTKKKPVGLVYIGVGKINKTSVHKFIFNKKNALTFKRKLLKKLLN
jgi:PncC family amidohydrolase